MIVKNEAARIERCLRSVKPFISHYAIVDTGSMDGTQAIISKVLEPIQGVVVDRSWEGFSENRNQAIQLAQEYYGKDCDWLLTIDADETLEVPEGYQFSLDPDIGSYLGMLEMGNVQYRRRVIVRNDGNWKYVRRVHEVLVPFKRDAKEMNLDGPVWKDHCDSSRRQDPDRFLMDAALLLLDWKEHQEPRTAFYLAQSYRDAGWKQKAMEWYIKRTQLGGWEEEIYYSLYMAAVLKFETTGDIFHCIEDFIAAYQFRPSRMEALWILCRELRSKQAWLSVKLFASWGLNSTPSRDILFVDVDSHWLIMEEYALAEFYTGNIKGAWDVFQRIKKTWQLDGEARLRLAKNIEICESRLIGSFGMPPKQEGLATLTIPTNGFLTGEVVSKSQDITVKL